jgi:hypothetical protein
LRESTEPLAVQRENAFGMLVAGHFMRLRRSFDQVQY